MISRKRSTVALSAGVLLLISMPAVAQRRVIIDTSVTNGPGPAPGIGLQDWRRNGRMMVTVTRRQRLGVLLNMQPSDADTLGALVTGVTPRGPAAKAGIHSGDIITSLNGESLLGSLKPMVTADDASLPASRLVELASKLKANDTVLVKLRRGNESKQVTLVTGEDGSTNTMSMRSNEPLQMTMRRNLSNDNVDVRGMDGFRVSPDDIEDTKVLRDDAGGEVFMSRVVVDDGIRGLELAPLNSDLGAYFGTAEGILVIAVPKVAGLDLKSGDVVLAIDGRRPSSPAGMMRILGSYDRGDAVKLEIMRNRKHEVVSGKIPGRRSKDGEEE